MMSAFLSVGPIAKSRMARHRYSHRSTSPLPGLSENAAMAQQPSFSIFSSRSSGRHRTAGCPHRHGQLRDPQNCQGQGGFARRTHYHVHFTPTSGSWINQVEHWFAELTRKQLLRGVHRSTGLLEIDIAPSVERFCTRTEQTLCSEF